MKSDVDWQVKSSFLQVRRWLYTGLILKNSQCSSNAQFGRRLMIERARARLAAVRARDWKGGKPGVSAEMINVIQALAKLMQGTDATLAFIIRRHLLLFY